MERERVEAIVAELNCLLEEQLETLKTVNLSHLTPGQTIAYDQRYRRIRQLCQELGCEERATTAIGA